MVKRPRPRPRRGPDAVARRLAELERENRRLAAENRALKAASKRAGKSVKADVRAVQRAGKSAGKGGAEAIREGKRAASAAGRAARRGAPGASPRPPRPPGSGGTLLPGWRRAPGTSRTMIGPGGVELSRRQYDKLVEKSGVHRREISDEQREAAKQGTRHFALFARAHQTRQKKLGVHLSLGDIRKLPALKAFRREAEPILREIRSLPRGDPERMRLIHDLVDLWYEYDMDFEMFKELMEELSP